MKTTTLIISIVVSLAIGSGIGYFFGRGANDNSVQDKELRDSIVMMKEQSLNIQKMGEMMKSGGMMMQEMGMKHKNDEAVVRGKDMEMMGKKYMEEDIKASEDGESMKQMMEH